MKLTKLSVSHRFVNEEVNHYTIYYCPESGIKSHSAAYTQYVLTMMPNGISPYVQMLNSRIIQL